MVERDALYIGGRWRPARGTRVIEVVSPATEEVVARVPAPDDTDLDDAVRAARRAFDATSGPDRTWRSYSAEERAAVLDRVAVGLTARAEELAQTITLEMGSPITTSRTRQVPPSLGMLGYYADLLRSGSLDEVRPGGYGTSLVVREPIGVVAAIIPWNVPLTMAIGKLAPALAAGCTVVLKPAPETPLSGYLLAEVLDEVGLPEGVVSIVAGDAAAGARLVAHPAVDKVAFTGSAAAGRQVLHAAADRIGRVSLELGGKSAAVVLDDADLASTVERLLPMTMPYTGQACHAQTRILIPRARQDELVERLVAGVAAMVVGDPHDEATEVGPLVSRRQRDRVESHLSAGREAGARAVIGGGRPAHCPVGWYVEPTVLVDVDNGMRIAREEIFGPVVCVLPYDDPTEAVAMANDSDYGLAGSVWSSDEDRALAVARLLRTGSVSINGRLQSAAAPFGGYKQSGLGRESGPEGLHGYQELKAIAVAPS